MKVHQYREMMRYLTRPPAPTSSMQVAEVTRDESLEPPYEYKPEQSVTPEFRPSPKTIPVMPDKPSMKEPLMLESGGRVEFKSGTKSGFLTTTDIDNTKKQILSLPENKEGVSKLKNIIQNFDDYLTFGKGIIARGAFATAALGATYDNLRVGNFKEARNDLLEIIDVLPLLNFVQGVPREVGSVFEIQREKGVLDYYSPYFKNKETKNIYPLIEDLRKRTQKNKENEERKEKIINDIEYGYITEAALPRYKKEVSDLDKEIENYKKYKQEKSPLIEESMKDFIQASIQKNKENYGKPSKIREFILGKTEGQSFINPGLNALQKIFSETGSDELINKVREDYDPIYRQKIIEEEKFEKKEDQNLPDFSNVEGVGPITSPPVKNKPRVNLGPISFPSPTFDETMAMAANGGRINFDVGGKLTDTGKTLEESVREDHKKYNDLLKSMGKPTIPLDNKYIQMWIKTRLKDGGIVAEKKSKAIPMDLESVSFRLFGSKLDDLTYNQKQTVYDYIEDNRNKKADGGRINFQEGSGEKTEFSEIPEFKGNIYTTVDFRFANGGRIGFADGPDDPTKRKFVKGAGILGLLAAGAKFLPDIFQSLKGSKTTKIATKVLPKVSGMPEWFPSLVAKIEKEGVDVIGKAGVKDLVYTKKIEIPVAGEKNPETIFMTKYPDGIIEINTDMKGGAYGEAFELYYKPPKNIIDEKTGKVIEKKGEFNVIEQRPKPVGGPEDADYEFEYELVSKEDAISDLEKIEQKVTGKIKDPKIAEKRTARRESYYQSPYDDITDRYGDPGDIEYDRMRDAGLFDE